MIDVEVTAERAAVDSRSSSPNKRSHLASLSSPSSDPMLDRSPPISRTKLTASSIDRQRATDLAHRVPTTTVEATNDNDNDDDQQANHRGSVLLPMKSASDGAAGEAIMSNATIGQVPRTADAEEQTRRLMAMTIEESESLSRLASQHHLSSYNASKRVNLASMVMVAPPHFIDQQRLHLAPVEQLQRPVALQRSLSSPTASTFGDQRDMLEATRPTTTATTKLTSGVASASWSMFRNATAGWTDNFPLRKSATPPSATPPPPSSSSSVTPLAPSPSTLTSDRSMLSKVPTNLASILNTTLNPSVFNFSFSNSSNSSSTPSTPPIVAAPRAMHPSELSNALLDASTVDSNIAAASSVDEAQREVGSAATERTESMVDPRTVPLPASETAAVAGLLPGMKMMNGIAVKTSVSHPMNVSHIIPPEILPLISAHLFAPSRNDLDALPSSSTSAHSSQLHTPFLVRQSPHVDLFDLTRHSNQYFLPAPAPSDAVSLPLGNFLLSSCPGKKVRLTANSGPGGGLVKGGRSAICRDLELDLRRVMEEGAKVIVCCLDDQELAYLGAPWEEYSRLSTQLSLHVLRIPMVEGYAPFSPASLDAHLSKLILEQSLQGSSILSQCRGGQGRAGTVAVCWMIKMGLVGDGGQEGGRHQLEDPMRVVERVIEVVRRRRGLKAIETPQHVHFILEYVKYLRSNAKVYEASEIRSLHSHSP